MSGQVKSERNHRAPGDHNNREANEADRVRFHGKSTKFFVLAHPGMVTKWRNDKTIPLVDVVEIFKVYEDTAQVAGAYSEASHSQLE